MEKMETVDTRLGALEKRVDKHGEEIDDLTERTHKVETSQQLFELQLEQLIEIKDGIKEINTNLTGINDTVSETKHRLDMVERDHYEYKTESKDKVLNLEKQRNIDHNIKPSETREKLFWQIVSIVTSLITAAALIFFGLNK